MESGTQVRANLAGALHQTGGVRVRGRYHKTDQWLALNAARAIDNSVYVAGVCQMLPIGGVEAVLTVELGGRAADISFETVARVRGSFPMFRRRRLQGWRRFAAS